ncbi:unnamed protein product [Rhizophagus irregularis]|nr:unnamed protein product [Rhizophagus irregularis]
MSRRKRSVSALLSNDEESITARSSRKNKAISRVIDEESEESTLIIHTHDRRMVPCNCSKYLEVVQDYSNPLSSSFEDYNNPLPSLFENYSNSLPLSSKDYGNPLPKDNPVLSDEDSDNN